MVQVKFVNALGIDVGSRRIGIARVNSIAKIPEPLGTLINDETFPDAMTRLLVEHSIDIIVIGLPRNLRGEETPQTNTVRLFVDDIIKKNTDKPVQYQDETLTSVAAGNYSQDVIAKFGLDSLAAVEILKDFIKEKTQ